MISAQQIKNAIYNHGDGRVFCANDFSDYASRGNIDVILHRLAKDGIIRKLGYGLYDLPRKSAILGDLSPAVNDIIKAYARRTGHVFVLDPLNAANTLGLTTQVPSQLRYLTNGKSHTMVICGIDIHFIHAAPKNLAGANSSAALFVQAMRYFGKSGMTDDLLTYFLKIIPPKNLDALINFKNELPRNLSAQIERIQRYATIH